MKKNVETSGATSDHTMSNKLVESAMTLIFLAFWFGGIAIAKGWFAVLALFFPPYAWYLAIEKILQLNGYI